MEQMQTSLEQRLALLESRVALSDLVASYFALVDAKNCDSLADLFVADAWFEVPGGQRIITRDAIQKWFRRRLEAFEFTFHYPHAEGFDISVTDGVASGLITAHAEHGIAGRCHLAALRYHDTYHRGDGAWLIQSRRIEFVYFLPSDQFNGQYRLGNTSGRP
jgi:hypothetical protein